MGKELTKLFIQEDERRLMNENAKKAENEEHQNDIYDETRRMLELRESARNKQKSKINVKKKVRDSLLSEAILNLYDKSLGNKVIYNKNNDIMKRNLVNTFIKEESSLNLLENFGSTSYLLSETSRVVNKYTDIIVEKCGKNESIDMINIEPDDKDNFFDDLEAIDDNEEVAAAIRMRVNSAVEQFMNDNIKQKAEIKDIIDTAQIRADASKKDEVKESYSIQAKSKISDLTNKRIKSIFECMVYNVAESSLINESMRNIYTKQNKLDMDLIVESCEVLYTFLEMINTAKMKRINENYIYETLEGLKS